MEADISDPFLLFQNLKQIQFMQTPYQSAGCKLRLHILPLNMKMFIKPADYSLTFEI